MVDIKTKKSANNFDDLNTSIKNEMLDVFYIFHGEERYLLENSLERIRKLLCPGGLDGFNYKRFDGKGVTADELEDAINTLPAFAEKSLIEVHEFDIFKSDVKERMHGILTDLPDYVCVIFVYGTLEYKPDGRAKTNKEIIKKANVIEFTVQEQDKLIKWIKRHFQDAGKNITTNDAEYLAFITGGLMITLNSEIEKTAAYSKNETVSRTDIDAVVTPVLDTVVYKLTDALVTGNNKKALMILDELYQMKEVPHKLIFSISLKMRQLLVARICFENKQDILKLKEMCSIRHDFQARFLMDTAKKSTLQSCRNAVLYSSQTAFELNSSSEPESRITELIAGLAFNR